MTFDYALARAMEHLRAGQLEPASALLNEVLGTAPDEPDALQLLGLVARARKHHERAAELFRQSLRTKADQPHVLNNLGNTLLDLKRPIEAIEAYRAALALQPSYGDAITNLGLAYIAAGDAQNACEALRRAADMDSTNAKAWSALGRALRASDRLDEAIAAFGTALSLRPNSLPTRHNLAVTLRLAGKPEQAVGMLEECAAANPSAAEIRYNLGHCYYDLGRLDEAAAAYRAAIAAKPSYRDAHDSLNRLLWQRGDTTHYLRSYAEALRRDPDDADLLADLANRLNLDGRTADTVRLLEDALARGVDSPSIRHRLGQACWAEGDKKAALSHLEAGMGSGAGIDCRLELVRCLIVQGRYDHALEAVAPALEARPFDQQAIAYQGLAWRLLGDPRAERLNDYDRFVSARILQPPEGWGSVERFNARLEKVLESLHTTRQHPLEQTLRGGTQTMGELFDRDVPEISAVRRMIEAAVEEYIAALPNDPSHLFLKRRTDGFRFSGSWSVRLRREGFHLNHVHSKGWISSCYYVGLPGCTADEARKEGWIKFGETGFSLGERETIARTLKPEVGKLILFPSYLYHGTIPFAADSPRTTIAFDVVPR
ncbi:tetratricopeptide repeat protein [Sphingosinicella sp. CPCC 101087]|uniref:tetratricopeptide repeat protein n=1 Tax=Sphingosinicella sp. CPCC 101087 TaxID=2497754 RepID=UPI0013EBEFEA|nr:tetratricopeptide repeat protein [Sphingosinicella sp. CPCC 101087]